MDRIFNYSTRERASRRRSEEKQLADNKVKVVRRQGLERSLTGQEIAYVKAMRWPKELRGVVATLCEGSPIPLNGWQMERINTAFDRLNKEGAPFSFRVVSIQPEGRGSGKWVGAQMKLVPTAFPKEGGK